MVSPTTRWLVASLAAVLTSVAGCGAPPSAPTPEASSSSGSESAGPAESSGSTGDGACGSDAGFCVTVSITGAVTLQGTAQALNLGTCADFVKNTRSTDGSLQFPGLLGEPIGGREVSSVNEISDYTGPGTYDKDKIRSVAGVIDVSIDNTPYQLDDATTAAAVINPDGSGSFTFTDLKEGEEGNPTAPKGTISGSFTWTCRD
jgi:hypothetical protein